MIEQVAFCKNEDFIKLPWRCYALRKSDILSFFTKGTQIVVNTWNWQTNQTREIIGNFKDVETAENMFRKLWEAFYCE